MKRIDDSDVSGPIQLFPGVPDDYNPIALCRSYVERLRIAGKDVQLTEYADTWHVFDSPTNPITPRRCPSSVIWTTRPITRTASQSSGKDLQNSATLD